MPTYPDALDDRPYFVLNNILHKTIVFLYIILAQLLDSSQGRTIKYSLVIHYIINTFSLIFNFLRTFVTYFIIIKHIKNKF